MFKIILDFAYACAYTAYNFNNGDQMNQITQHQEGGSSLGLVSILFPSSHILSRVALTLQCASIDIKKETGNSGEGIPSLLPLERGRGQAPYRVGKLDALLSRRTSKRPQPISLSHNFQLTGQGSMATLLGFGRNNQHRLRNLPILVNIQSRV